MNNFGFWLLPPKQIQAKYQSIIDRYSQRLKTPRFEPHITILDTLKGEKDKIVQLTKKVALDLKSIPVSFSEIAVSTTYFQCVFARVRPNLALFQAHWLLKSRLNHAGKTMYVPHMSLVYGDINISKRFEIAKLIKLPINKFKTNRLCVVGADSLDPKTWLHVAEFELKSTTKAKV